jgi:hypothetical protein
MINDKKNISKAEKKNSNKNKNYEELNEDNTNKDKDNNDEGISNNQEENENDNEELSSAEINKMKKIHEQTILRTKKYSSLYSPQDNDKKFDFMNSNEKLKDDNEEKSNVIEICDNDISKEQTLNPNKERIFRNIHCFLYWKNEPLIIIGPHLIYFIIIFTSLSFICILIHSLKENSDLKLIFILGYALFAIIYILLMISNPGIPSVKKDYDIDYLKSNYTQCDLCNCIYPKNIADKVKHCKNCGICVEGHEHHNYLATKCIGNKNIKLFKLWLYTSIVFSCIIFFYILF